MWAKDIYADSDFCFALQSVPLLCWNPLSIIDLYDNNAQKAIQEPAAIPMNIKMTLHYGQDWLPSSVNSITKNKNWLHCGFLSTPYQRVQIVRPNSGHRQ